MSRSTGTIPIRRLLSLGLLILGILLLAFVPAYVALLAFSGTKTAHIGGSLLILTVVGGMASVLISSALRE